MYGTYEHIQDIRNKQRQEGYTPCYGTGQWDCPYQKCCFRQKCLGLAGTVKAVYIINVLDKKRFQNTP